MAKKGQKDTWENDNFQNAKKTKDPAHAFMHFGSKGSRKKAFEDLYSRQRALYDSIGL